MIFQNTRLVYAIYLTLWSAQQKWVKGLATRDYIRDFKSAQEAVTKNVSGEVPCVKPPPFVFVFVSCNNSLCVF